MSKVELEEYWNYLIEAGIATEQELQLFESSVKQEEY
jgi:hypothetical protein